MTIDTKPILTERLELILLPQPFLEATANGSRTFAERVLGLVVPSEWHNERALARMRNQQIQADPGVHPWLLRAVTLRRERVMVGYIGFHDRPGAAYLEPYAPGGLELGYTIFSKYRRNGYAREAMAGLMDWARRQGVTRFVVSIRPDNEASNAMARSFGFQPVGEHMDPEDGLEIIHVLELPAEAPAPGE